MNLLPGIDSNHYSDESSSDPYPDFEVAKDEYAFNNPKASEGQTLKDEEFDAAVDDMVRIGRAWGGFHFYRARTATQSPIKQAENFWSVLEPHGLPITGAWLDCETNDEHLSVNMYLDHVWKFLDRFKVLSGKDAGIYTRKYFWDQFANATNGYSDIPRDHELWVANYAVLVPKLPLDWVNRGKTYTFWQDGTIVLPGFKSPVDHDLFNGDLAVFNQKFGTNVIFTPPVPPPPPPVPPLITPDKIKIKGLVPGDHLRMRDNVWGNEVAYTTNGKVFSVENFGLDSDHRVWYQLGKSIWIASWYAEPV